MYTLLRYLILFSVCLLLTGCVTGAHIARTKQTPSLTTPIEPLIPFSNSIQQVKKVALLLPLQGTLGNAGQAVRDGFITAYNSDNSANKPKLMVIDASSGSIQDAYNKAIQADADIVVGPLLKNNVQTLIQADLISVPTLTLNYLDNNTQTPSKLYQFGLSPLDEARQATALARQNGGQNAVIIAPHDNWGQMLAHAYQDEWQALGGNIVNKLYFSNASGELNQQIRTLVNVNKQKFDVILLAASPQMARQIKPLLKFYNAGSVPVYATSLIYTGTPQPAFDNDLNGITFCDTPWTLTNDSVTNKLRQQISLFWAANFKQNARLYALGIDAYHLIKNLPQLTNQQTISGATGNLFLNNQHRIVRQLTCAKFNNGIPRLLNTDSVDNTDTDNTANIDTSNDLSSKDTNSDSEATAIQPNNNTDSTADTINNDDDAQ